MIGVYLACAVAGAAFVLFTNLFGHAAGGHGHGSHAMEGGDASLPLFSPTALAAYLTGFGSTGLVLTKGLGVTSPFVHIPIATAGAVGFGVGLIVGMAKLARHTEGNSLASVGEVIGQQVEVTVSIPAGGEGEVAYVSGATRQAGIARAEARQSFTQGTQVRVTRSSDGVLWVTRGAAPAREEVPVGEPQPGPPREKVR